MLKEHAKLIRMFAITIDLILVAVAFSAAYLLHQYWGGVIDHKEHFWLLLVILPMWSLLLAKYEFYGSIRRRTVFQIITALVNVHLWGGMVVAATIYLLQPHGFGRVLYLAFILLSFILLTSLKVLTRISLGVFRRRGYNYRNILIVGTNDKAINFKRLLDEYADWGLRAIGFVRANDDERGTVIDGLPVIGGLPELIEICKSRPVDEVVICNPKAKTPGTVMECHIRELEEIGITVNVLLEYLSGFERRQEFNFFDNEFPMLTFRSNAINGHQLFLKRLIDISGALIGLGLTVMLLPFIAVAIKKDSPGPIFFGQDRVGENGRIFRLWKFRSMCLDADACKRKLVGQNEMNGAMFKMKNDPRITRVGKLLRQTSLDELPQFWNVLKGEMSLVGTRPPIPDEVLKYQNWQRRRLSIKPGITGLWQVSGRNRVRDFDEIVRLDLSYIDTWSVWLEIKILLRTVKVVFTHDGSY